MPSFVEAFESVVVEAVDYCRLLRAIERSIFVEAVKFIVETVDCCRLLSTLEGSSFVEAAESVDEAVDYCRLHYVL